MRASFAVSLILALLLPLGLAAPAESQSEEESPPGRSIVLLRDGSDPPVVARSHGAVPDRVYTAAARGFAARLTEQQIGALKADPRVDNVLPDRVFSVAPEPDKGRPTAKPGKPPAPQPTQKVPTGIARIGLTYGVATYNYNAATSQKVAVAVIDTGVYKHPDLNIAGNASFVGSGKVTTDQYGHGTHVAGTIGAIDNAFGVVGVLPGVPIYNVRVLGAGGWGYLSDIIEGIEWVTERTKDPNYAGVTWVANMSLGGGGGEIGPCGVKDGSTVDAYHAAICKSAAAGVVYVVAAGNESNDAAYHTPAAYNEVITVSAIADGDGAPGGGVDPACWPGEEDDTFADFSNYGADVDIAAPGVCILSTWKDGGYREASGTSMATPHVAGAVARLVYGGLVIPKEPSQSAMEARDAAVGGLLVRSVEQTEVKGRTPLGFTGDPDYSNSCNDTGVAGFCDEPLLYSISW